MEGNTKKTEKIYTKWSGERNRDISYCKKQWKMKENHNGLTEVGSVQSHQMICLDFKILDMCFQLKANDSFGY